MSRALLTVLLTVTQEHLCVFLIKIPLEFLGFSVNLRALLIRAASHTFKNTLLLLSPPSSNKAFYLDFIC